jgi:hypothetical protein
VYARNLSARSLPSAHTSNAPPVPPILAPWALAQLLRRTGRPKDAVPLYEQALVLFDKTAGPAHRTTTTCLLALAAAHDETGNPGRATALYQRAVHALREAAAAEPKKSPGLAAVLARLGEGSHADARALLPRADWLTRG